MNMSSPYSVYLPLLPFPPCMHYRDPRISTIPPPSPFCTCLLKAHGPGCLIRTTRLSDISRSTLSPARVRACDMFHPRHQFQHAQLVPFPPLPAPPVSGRRTAAPRALQRVRVSEAGSQGQDPVGHYLDGCSTSPRGLSGWCPCRDGD
jgi:hypothetical protein